jgi:hypothetical protein
MIEYVQKHYGVIPARLIGLLSIAVYVVLGLGVIAYMSIAAWAWVFGE